jgi:hypothetical protein
MRYGFRTCRYRTPDRNIVQSCYRCSWRATHCVTVLVASVHSWRVSRPARTVERSPHPMAAWGTKGCKTQFGRAHGTPHRRTHGWARELVSKLWKQLCSATGPSHGAYQVQSYRAASLVSFDPSSQGAKWLSSSIDAHFIFPVDCASGTMPLGKRTDYGDSKYAGVEPASIADLVTTLRVSAQRSVCEHSGMNGFMRRIRFYAASTSSSRPWSNMPVGSLWRKCPQTSTCSPRLRAASTC